MNIFYFSLFKTATVEECIEVAKNCTIAWEYLFLSVKNLYKIVDGKLFEDEDAILCTTAPFFSSTFEEIYLKKHHDSVSIVFYRHKLDNEEGNIVDAAKTYDNEKSKNNKLALLTMSLVFAVVLIGLFVLIGFLIFKLKRGNNVYIENHGMNEKTAPTMCVLDNNEEDFFVEYKA